MPTITHRHTGKSGLTEMRCGMEINLKTDFALKIALKNKGGYGMNPHPPSIRSYNQRFLSDTGCCNPIINTTADTKRNNTGSTYTKRKFAVAVTLECR